MLVTLLHSLFLIHCSLFVSPSWGFYGHQRINQLAVYLLPPEMMVFFKKNIDYLSEHAVDPDKRRYSIADEGPRHYIDLDHYGTFPFNDLPRNWQEAREKFTEDSLKAHGIVPWHIQVMLQRLTQAFREKNKNRILKLAAELGHYIADAHVPLHTSSNHNGQQTNQRGIHGFWESRVPEMLAEKEFDFFIGQAGYIADPASYTWNRVLESAQAVDSVLYFEKKLSGEVSPDLKYGFETRNGKIVRQYSTLFTLRYNQYLDGMVERRMRQSVQAVASLWLTAWVDAGQPSLIEFSHHPDTDSAASGLSELNRDWIRQGRMIGRDEGD